MFLKTNFLPWSKKIPVKTTDIFGLSKLVHFRRSPSQIKAPTLANNNYLFVKFLTFFGCVDLTLEGDGGDGVVERVHDLVVDHASVAKSVLKEKMKIV